MRNNSAQDFFGIRIAEIGFSCVIAPLLSDEQKQFAGSVFPFVPARSLIHLLVLNY